MNKIKIVRRTENFVKNRLAKEGTGHDWWHIERVRRNAKLICEKEKADWLVVELAALLHDIGDQKILHKKANDYSLAEKFLRSQRVSAEIIERVMFIIKNMSFSSSLNKKRAHAPKEFYVVQDADRLDALGAIGIARAFAYGGSQSRPLYDPKMESSTLHHFYEKLLLLKDLMNTKTAKGIARPRHRYLRDYLEQFLQEWAGRC